MVHTRNQYYRSFSPNYVEGAHVEDFGPAVDTDKAFEPISASDTTKRLRVSHVDTFDTMKGDRGIVVRGNCFENTQCI